jgi:hypothetical protein
MVYRNYEFNLQTVNNMPVWEQHRIRLQLYDTYWRFYRGSHWPYAAPTGEPNVTVNYTEKFVDLHNTYLFGKGFTFTANFQGQQDNQDAVDALSEEWEKNYVDAFGWEMGQSGGVFGDCWVHVGYDVDPVMGERVKLTVIPSQYVFPVFRHATSRTYDALVLSWPDTVVVKNDYGKISNRATRLGQYWTKDWVQDLEESEPMGPQKRNLLGEIPFIHIANLPMTGFFWGKSDIASVVDLNRELNEKYTDTSDIVNYHAAPVTAVYGAKIEQLQVGANRVWSGLPPNSRVERLSPPGVSMSVEYLQMLKDTLFQIGEISPNAFGGVEAISNTSGVALAMQFAPMLNHMAMRRLTYRRGIQRLNYLILKTREVLGTYKANGKVLPYFSDVKWPSPMPRDEQVELQNMQQMHAMQLLSRVQILRNLIIERVAPEELEANNADQLVQDAIEEELKWEQESMEAQQPPPPPLPPGMEQQPQGGPGGGGPQGQGPAGEPGITNNTAAAEKRSRQAQTASTASSVAA